MTAPKKGTYFTTQFYLDGAKHKGYVFVTTILLEANYSILFPFSFLYRFSIPFFDVSLAYKNQSLILWGSVIFTAYIIAPLFGLYKYSKKTRLKS